VSSIKKLLVKKTLKVERTVVLKE